MGRIDVIEQLTKAWALPMDPSVDATPASRWLKRAMVQQDAVAEARPREHIRRMLIDGRTHLRQLGCLMDDVEGGDISVRGKLKEVWRKSYALACRIQWCMFRLSAEAEELGVVW